MRKYIISATIFMFMTVAYVGAQTTERHSYKTAKEGDVYIMLKVGAPMTPEQMYFMSIVNRVNGLNVFTHIEPMNKQELQDYQTDMGSYHKRYEVPNLDWDQNKVRDWQKKTTEFPMKKLEDTSMLDALRINTFPNLVYLTPDGYIYRFSFMPFKSEAPIERFWQAYRKHKDQGEKLFRDKKWSM